jgi:hypothetical protein
MEEGDFTSAWSAFSLLWFIYSSAAGASKVAAVSYAEVAGKIAVLLPDRAPCNAYSFASGHCKFLK